MKLRDMLYTGLVAGAIGLVGCGENNEDYYGGPKPESDKVDIEEPAKPVNIYQFDDFRQIVDLCGAITQMKVKDLDDDGDLDIIVGTEYGELIIYENNMPQKRVVGE